LPENEKSKRFILKQRLLRRAWDGQSTLAANGADMILLIQMRLAQCKPAKDSGDQRVLDEVRLIDDDQPRSVRMLNALARHSGDETRYSAMETITIH